MRLVAPVLVGKERPSERGGYEDKVVTVNLRRCVFCICQLQCVFFGWEGPLGPYLSALIPC